VGTANINTSVVSDGRIFATCGELTIPASHTELSQTVTLTVGKWVCWTLDLKHVSGSLADLQILLTNGTGLAANLDKLLDTGKWATLAGVAPVESGGTVSIYLISGASGSKVLRMSAYQVVEFDTEQEAVNYYNGGAFRA
jgi:hypothetical protein